jgi:hypothetical protein
MDESYVDTFLWVVGTSTLVDLFLESINVASFHLLLVCFS